MGLPIPDLDDRSFDDLFEEARTLIAASAPGWTNHNPSDPGITLIELFAWLAEMLVYRANQVPDAHRLAFLRLLNGPEWTPRADLEVEVERTLAELRRRHRAVTVEDYEQLALLVSPNVARVHGVARRNLQTGRDVDSAGDISVIVVAGMHPKVIVEDSDGFLRDMTNEARSASGSSFALPGERGRQLYVGSPEPFSRIHFAFARGGVGYTLAFEYWSGRSWTQLRRLPELADGTSNWRHDGSLDIGTPPADWAPNEVADFERFWIRISSTTSATRLVQALQVEPDDQLLERVDAELESRRILGTSHHVLAPEYVPVAASIVAVRRPAADAAAVRAKMAEAIERFLDPLAGGPLGTGWPFGRPVYVSELHELLGALPEVDHVADLRLEPGASSVWVRPEEIWHEHGEQVGLDIGAHRLPEPDLELSQIVVLDRSLAVTVTVTVTPAQTASTAAVLKAVKEAVRAFFLPKSDPQSGYKPRSAYVLEPGMLRAPVEAALVALGTLGAIELRSDASRMSRDELLDVETVRVQDDELVESSTSVRVVA